MRSRRWSRLSLRCRLSWPSMNTVTISLAAGRESRLMSFQSGLGRFCFQPMFMAAFSTQAAADAHLTAFYQSIFCIIALKSWLEELYEFCCILHCTGIQKYVCVQKFSAKKFADKISIQKYQTMSSENLKPLLNSSIKMDSKAWKSIIWWH